MNQLPKKIKIAIAGIGGVGGYFGGQLAHHYENSNEVEIIFIARGENEKAIRQNGLKIEMDKGDFIARPHLISSNPDRISLVDYFICCTKNYGLEDLLLKYAKCINDSTAILPLLNGVDSVEKIKTIFPENEVWDGCVYIFSRLEKPGLIKVTGTIEKLFFGSEGGDVEKLKQLERIMLDAGIDAKFSKDIQQTIWKKFLLISAIGTTTSYYNRTVGEILKDENSKKMLVSLLTELKNISDKIHIGLPENITEQIMGNIKTFAFEATSSMHADFQKGKSTEVESLTGYVVRLGKKLNLPVNNYEKMYNGLINKLAGPKASH